jgi:uncharacterized protein (TIGR03663 family)
MINVQWEMGNGEWQMTDEKLAGRQTQSVLTVEVAVWILVAAIALALRLAHLDAAPLNAEEAREATLAWRAVTVQGMPGSGYSPFLLALDALLFALCGASDSLARLWPALLGGLLALTPWLLRQRIGRVGALVAGLYLALSPMALVASRQLDGAVAAALGGMAFLGGLVRFRDTDNRPWLTFSAGGLALAVTSSPSAYGLLLAMGLSWLLLAWAWPDGGIQRLRELVAPHLGHNLLVFVLVGLAFSTGIGWNPAGLGAAGGLLPAWIARFDRVASSVASPLTLLAVYEPLALLFGLGGLVWAIQHGHRPGVLLGLWAGLGALLMALMPGRTALDTLWALLPLALLTGVATESLVQNLRERGGWLSEGLYIPVVVILWVHLYLMLGRYAVSGRSEDLALALLTAALQVLLVMMFALAMRADAALRALGVGTGVVCLAATISAGWGSAYARPADPRELLVNEPTAVEVRDLVETLRDLSWRETGLPTTLPFTFEAAPDSVLAWYLRDFSAARRVEDLEGEVGSPEGEVGSVLVTAWGDLGGPEGADFVGQDFALARSWSPLEIGCTWEWPPQCSVGVKWLLFRSTPVAPVVDQRAVLWLRPDIASE